MSRAQLRDKLMMLRSLTVSRLWNAILLYSSFYLSKWFKRNWHLGMPLAVSIEPTTSCNLRCPECPSGLRQFERPTGMLESSTNTRILEELGDALMYITYYFQGEPFLNPRFTDMVQEASSRRIYTATSTNAHYLNDENCRKAITSGLKKLIISIDGLSQETYSKYRIGGNLDKVLEGTRNILKWKKELRSKTPYVVWQFIVFQHNEHEIDLIKEKAKELGVDHLAIKTAQLYNPEDKLGLIPTDSQYSRYEVTEEGVALRNKLLNQCWRMWHSAVLTWDGTMVPCCFDKDAEHGMGNIGQSESHEIWTGAEYNDFRSKLLKSRANIDMCRNCSEGTKIWS